MNKTFIIIQTGLLYNYIFLFIISIFFIVIKSSFHNIEYDIEVYILIFYSIFFINHKRNFFKSNGENSLFLIIFLLKIIFLFCLVESNNEDKDKDKDPNYKNLNKKDDIYSVNRIGAHNFIDKVYPDN
jgi:Ca2+/Na+ antiporter